MHILWLILFTLGAWLIHAGLAGFYSGLLGTKSASFRIVHAGEIAVTVFIMLIIYYAMINPPTLSAGQLIGILLGTLLVVDGILMLLSSSLRERFDILHFAVAYAAVALSVFIFLKTQNP